MNDDKPKRRKGDRFTPDVPLDSIWLRQMLPGGVRRAARNDRKSGMPAPTKDEVAAFVAKFDELLDEQYDKDDRVAAPDTEAPAAEPEKYSDRWNNLP